MPATTATGWKPYTVTWSKWIWSRWPDSDPEGRAAAGERTGAQRLYADFRQMLADEDLDIVSVCPRMPDCHADMVIACAEAGVRGVFIEKPLTPTLREADALLAACQEHGVKTAVAHRRANPYEEYGKKLVDEGVIGRLQVLRSHGKSDRRAGSQDLMVLERAILTAGERGLGFRLCRVLTSLLALRLLCPEDGREIARPSTLRDGYAEHDLQRSPVSEPFANAPDRR